MLSRKDEVLGKIDAYYSGKIREHGPVPLGVDWNSEQAQRIRFDQITKVCPHEGSYTLLDYGCGYGALAPYLHATNPHASYAGYDVSESMIEQARRLHGKHNCRFTSDPTELERSDTVVASGIFSVKMDVAESLWEEYVFNTLDQMAGLSRAAFSFNLLTAHSDPDRMRPDLYYADPLRFFEHCRTRYSRNVALLHDYGLYEFTILVRLTV